MIFRVPRPNRTSAERMGRIMKKSCIKWTILCGCIALLCAALAVSAVTEKQRDIQFAGETEFNRICAQLTQTDPPSAERGRLLMEGSPAPYDQAENCYYVPQSLETDGVDGALSWSNGGQTAVLCMDSSFPGKAEAIRSGTSFSLMIRNGSEYYVEQVVFTGMPAIVIDMETDNATFDLDSTAIASVSVFNPDQDTPGNYVVYTAQARLTLRGTSSINYEKKSYNLTLYDGQGVRSGLPLLNMRKDDQWILKSLLMDPMRARECVSSGIWNSICEDGGDADLETSDFRYTEVFLDDSYYGLFGLMTKIDSDVYGLDEDTDILFKARSFEFLNCREDDFDPPLFSESGIRFPKVWQEGVYDPIYWYVDALYLQSPDITCEEIKAHLNMENAVDYALFYMLVSARDNNFTNTYYLFRRDGDLYQTTLIPWDMDMTFGNSWDCVWTGEALPLSETETVLLPQQMRVLQNFDETGIQTLLSARWTELREGVWSDNALCALVEAAFDRMEDSGAIAREELRWTQPGVQRGEAYMLSYIRERAAFMDRYFS